ncbi:hypothetical protein DICPUDRAFT_88765 [Dictyostelium purpureum]|uniref:GST C-terminal domain-containing protein n=1 Tax=Dictyostelium purpureum TaxID=5786 RepID=F0ZRH8_DICPU|nr:uncharacterized protein DICPUDRAFT_88765 [Dictyostelium purpureum]EGC33457.1 hypothetical protein DICPUDRAFT_88765 [Dictyostelium purpureum]|eukprot:XP_003290028.1 hypothetical protein DICPUDRAFT_88765 [Dictyostelium purpureum]
MSNKGLEIKPNTIDFENELDKKGAFIRIDSSFRDHISKDHPIFKPEANRYHLYVSYACPWANRTLMFLNLKGLEDIIDYSVVDYILETGGWKFSTRHGSTVDKINNFPALRDVYLLTDKEYSGRITVPVLFDKKTQRIVNNESSEIIRMLNSQFNDFAKNPALDLCPSDLLTEIDKINEFVYPNINNGVYRCGFAVSQEAYDDAFEKLFAALDKVEEILSKQRYLVGSRFTEADVRLFSTLIRFDCVYVGHFKCNKRQIKEYPNLSNYTREIYQMEPIKSTINFFHIKHHYYGSHRTINPYGIVPNGPNMDYINEPHDRNRFN